MRACLETVKLEQLEAELAELKAEVPRPHTPKETRSTGRTDCGRYGASSSTICFGEERQFCSGRPPFFIKKRGPTVNVEGCSRSSALWIGFCRVDNGQVADDDTMSAVYRLRTALESRPPTMRGARVIG